MSVVTAAASQSLLGYDTTAQSNILINPTDTFAGSNTIFQSTQATVAAVTLSTNALDLTASVNIVTSGTSSAGGGVQLPLSTAAINLGGYAGSNACIQIVNATGYPLAIWPHGTETIYFDGGASAPLPADTMATFCPVPNTGWIGK